MNIESNFSTWSLWDRRSSLLNIYKPGIYALSIDGYLHGEPFSWSPEIAYFGMTNSVAGLAGRLKQFDNVLRGKPGHGGGQRFIYDHEPNGDLRHRLYVAVWCFDCDVRSNSPRDLRVMGEICKAEYECFAQYAERFGRLPKYNDKKGSPKRSIETTPATDFAQ